MAPPALLTTILLLLTVTRAARLAAGTGTVGRTGPAFLCSSSLSWVSAIMRLCTMAEIASCWFSPGFAPPEFCCGEAEAVAAEAVEEVGRSGLARGAVGSLLAMEVGTEIVRRSEGRSGGETGVLDSPSVVRGAMEDWRLGAGLRPG